MSKRGIEELGTHAKSIARLEGLFCHKQSIDFREEK
jgi:histidinol dehydrogenase